MDKDSFVISMCGEKKKRCAFVQLNFQHHNGSSTPGTETEKRESLKHVHFRRSFPMKNLQMFLIVAVMYVVCYVCS